MLLLFFECRQIRILIFVKIFHKLTKFIFTSFTHGMRILFNTNYNNYNTNFKSRQANVSKEEIKNLINKGYSTAEIGKFFGKSKAWASGIVKNYGFRTLHMENVQRLTNEIEDLILSGKSMSDIAKEFNVSKRVVYDTAIFAIGKEDLKEVKREGKNNKIRQEVEKLRPRIENNQDTSDFYDEKLNGFKIGVKHAEVQMRKEIREANKQAIANKVLDLVRKGLSIVQALKELNLKNTVNAYIDKAKLKQAREEGKQYKFNKIRDYVKQGYKVRQIAKEMGCTEETVYIMMGKEYRANWRKDRMQSRIKNILEYKLEGMSNEEIAKKMNLSISTIQRTMQNLDK